MFVQIFAKFQDKVTKFNLSFTLVYFKEFKIN